MTDCLSETDNRSSANRASETSAQPVPHGSWLWLITAGAGALALGIGVLALFWFFRRPLAVLFLGVTLASALAPVVTWLERWLPRNWATILIYLVLVLFVIGVGAIILPMLVDQAEQLVDRAPTYAEEAREWMEQRLGIQDGLPYERLLSQVTNIASTLATLPVQISSSLIDAVLVVFISIYTLLLLPDARKTLLSLFPAERRDSLGEVLQRMAYTMGGYFRGATITGAVIGSLAYVGLLIIGVDFALVSAIIAGLAEFIPFIGPFIAGAIIVGISFLQAPNKALFSLIFVVVLQQVEGNLIAPNVMHPQTGISPLATLVTLFAGWSVGGVLGALVAIPLYAGLRVLAIRVLFPAIRRQTGAVLEEQDETN